MMNERVQRARGLAYCVVWFSSILLGFFVFYAPLLPLLILHRKSYRKYTDILFTIWESFNVSLLQLILGVEFYVTGDNIRAEETSLIVVNHRTRVDWNFLWAAFFHGSVPTAGHNAKLVLKDEVKNLPGVGWTMQMSRFMYISRKWKADEVRMGRLLDLLTSDSRPFQMLLFPEGTNLTKETKAKSDKFAVENNLKPLQFVLQPRTTGFSFLAERLQQNGRLDAIYDVTLAYPDVIPEDEKALSEGNLPKQIRFHIKRYGTQNIPTTIIGLEKWLQELWTEKDQLLESCYSDQQPFPAFNPLQTKPVKPNPLQYLSLAFWLSFLYWAIFSFVFSLCGFLWIIFITGVMFVVSKCTGGLQDVEVFLEKEGCCKGIFKAVFGAKKED